MLSWTFYYDKAVPTTQIKLHPSLDLFWNDLEFSNIWEIWIEVQLFSYVILFYVEQMMSQVEDEEWSISDRQTMKNKSNM